MDNKITEKILLSDKDKIIIEIIKAVQTKSFDIEFFYNKYGESEIKDILMFCTQERLLKGIRAKVKKDKSIEVCVLKHPIVTFSGLIFLHDKGVEI